MEHSSSWKFKKGKPKLCFDNIFYSEEAKFSKEIVLFYSRYTHNWDTENGHDMKYRSCFVAFSQHLIFKKKCDLLKNTPNLKFMLSSNNITMVFIIFFVALKFYHYFCKYFPKLTELLI